jgi:SAM-dependent methyltransferase
VRSRYGDRARTVLAAPAGSAAPVSCCGPASNDAAGCCAPANVAAIDLLDSTLAPLPAATASTAALLYTAEETTGLPDSVTAISLGCGNPTAMAALQPGQTVLDLGSGGGIDCFLAARRVGPTGRVIGLDMTTDMIRLGRRNAQKMGLSNVEFQWGEIEEIPLGDETVDVILSNCVINLSPDKPQVFREAYRVLRPGGTLAVSDMVFEVEIPEDLRANLDSWAGCVAGAWLESDYLAVIAAAGFQDVEVVSRDYLPVEETLSAEDVTTLSARLPADIRNVPLERVMASIKVRAVKR